MARGKHLSLEEARNLGKLDQFVKEHETTGDMEAFGALLDRMVKKPSAGGPTSTPGASEGYAGTRTPRGISEDASG